MQLAWKIGSAAILLLVLVVSVALVVRRLDFFVPRVCLQRYERLKVGMPERAARNILGEEDRTLTQSAMPNFDARLRERFDIKSSAYPRRLFWKDGEDLIWIELRNGKVARLGAVLEGEQYGEQVPETKLGEERQELEDD